MWRESDQLERGEKEIIVHLRKRKGKPKRGARAALTALRRGKGKLVKTTQGTMPRSERKEDFEKRERKRGEGGVTIAIILSAKKEKRKGNETELSRLNDAGSWERGVTSRIPCRKLERGGEHQHSGR